MTLTNQKNILYKDMSIKKARYVARNIELNQEFHFASFETKIKINELYNSSWFGSVMYMLYGTEAVKLESSYNRSIKIMMDLPYETHRGLIEPISGRLHFSKILLKRFIVMTESLRRAKKPILRALLSEIEHNARSNTGRNLRMIMMQTDKSDIREIQIRYWKYPIFWSSRGWRLEGGDAEAPSGGAREEPSEWGGPGVAELSLLWLAIFTNNRP